MSKCFSQNPSLLTRMNTSDPMFKFTLFVLSLTVLVRRNFSYDQHLNTVCSESAPKYRANSTFHHNLNRLLSTITSNISSHSGFYNATTGHGADKVYGLAQCRGDVPSATCLECAKDAVSEIVQSCENETSAIIWFDNCLLRYSHIDFFGNVTKQEGLFIMVNGNNASDPSVFEQRLKPLVHNLISMATSNGSAALFAAGAVQYKDAETIHGMVQCTRDLSPSSCRHCLEAESAYLPIKQGARVVGSSCTLRYETYPFLYSTAMSPTFSPAPMASPPSFLAPSPEPAQLSPPSSPPAALLPPSAAPPAALLPPSTSPPEALPPASAASLSPFQSAPQAPAVPPASPSQSGSSGDGISTVSSPSSMMALLFVLIPIVVGLQQ